MPGFEFMTYFVRILIEKQHFQLWSSIKSAKSDISTNADTVLLEIYLRIELRKILFNKMKCFERIEENEINPHFKY